MTTSYIEKLEAWFQAKKEAGEPSHINYMRTQCSSNPEHRVQRFKDLCSECGAKSTERPLVEVLDDWFLPEGFFPGSGSVGERPRALYATDPGAARENLAEFIFNLLSGVTKTTELKFEDLDSGEPWQENP